MNHRREGPRMAPQACHHKNAHAPDVKRKLQVEISKEVAILSIAIPFLTKEQIYLRVLDKLGLKSEHLAGKGRLVKKSNQRLDYKTLSVYIPQSSGSNAERRGTPCLASPRYLRKKLLGRSKPVRIIDQRAALATSQESDITYQFSTPSSIHVISKFTPARPPKELPSKKKTPKRKLFSFGAGDEDWLKESTINVQTPLNAEDSDGSAKRRLSSCRQNSASRNALYARTPTGRDEYERLLLNMTTGKTPRSTRTSKRPGSSSDRPNKRLRYQSTTVGCHDTMDKTNRRVSNGESSAEAAAKTNKKFDKTADVQTSREGPSERNLCAAIPGKPRSSEEGVPPERSLGAVTSTAKPRSSAERVPAERSLGAVRSTAKPRSSEEGVPAERSLGAVRSTAKPRSSEEGVPAERSLGAVRSTTKPRSSEEGVPPETSLGAMTSTAKPRSSEEGVPPENLRAVTPTAKKCSLSLNMSSSTRCSDRETCNTSAIREVTTSHVALGPVAADPRRSLQTKELASLDANVKAPIRSVGEKNALRPVKVSRLSLSLTGKSSRASDDSRTPKGVAIGQITQRQATTENGDDRVDKQGLISPNVQVYSEVQNNKLTPPEKIPVKHVTICKFNNVETRAYNPSPSSGRHHDKDSESESGTGSENVGIQNTQNPEKNEVTVSLISEINRSSTQIMEVSEETDGNCERCKSDGHESPEIPEQHEYPTPLEQFVESMSAIEVSDIDEEPASRSRPGLNEDKDATGQSSTEKKLTRTQKCLKDVVAKVASPSQKHLGNFDLAEIVHVDQESDEANPSLQSRYSEEKECESTEEEDDTEIQNEYDPKATIYSKERGAESALLSSGRDDDRHTITPPEAISPILGSANVAYNPPSRIIQSKTTSSLLGSAIITSSQSSRITSSRATSSLLGSAIITSNQSSRITSPGATSPLPGSAIITSNQPSRITSGATSPLPGSAIITSNQSSRITPSRATSSLLGSAINTGTSNQSSRTTLPGATSPLPGSAIITSNLPSRITPPGATSPLPGSAIITSNPPSRITPSRATSSLLGSAINTGTSNQSSRIILPGATSPLPGSAIITSNLPSRITPPGATSPLPESANIASNPPSKIKPTGATSRLLGSAMITPRRPMRSLNAMGTKASISNDSADQDGTLSDIVSATPFKFLSEVPSEKVIHSTTSSFTTPASSGSSNGPSDPEGALTYRSSPAFRFITSTAVSRATSAKISDTSSSQCGSVTSCLLRGTPIGVRDLSSLSSGATHISDSYQQKDSFPISRSKKWLAARPSKSPPSSTSASDGSTNAALQSSPLTVSSEKTLISRGSSDYISSDSIDLNLNASVKSSPGASASNERRSCSSRLQASTVSSDTPTSSSQTTAPVRKKGLPIVAQFPPNRTWSARRVLFANDEENNSPGSEEITRNRDDVGGESDEEQVTSEATITNDQHQARAQSLLQNRFSSQLKQRQESISSARLSEESRSSINSLQQRLSSSPDICVSPVLLRKGADKLDGLPFNSGEAVRPATSNWLHAKKSASQIDSPDYETPFTSSPKMSPLSSLHSETSVKSQSRRPPVISSESLLSTALLITSFPSVAPPSLPETSKVQSNRETKVSSSPKNTEARQESIGPRRHQNTGCVQAERHRRKINPTQRNMRPIQKLTIRRPSVQAPAKVVFKRVKSVRPVTKLIMTRSAVKENQRSVSTAQQQSSEPSPRSFDSSQARSSMRSSKRSNSSSKWWMEEDVLKGLSQLTSSEKDPQRNQGKSQCVTRGSINRYLR